jgi:hypothetical protein
LGEDQQVQISVGMAELFRVRFQHMFTAVANRVVALLHTTASSSWKEKDKKFEYFSQCCLLKKGICVTKKKYFKLMFYQ